MKKNESVINAYMPIISFISTNMSLLMKIKEDKMTKQQQDDTKRFKSKSPQNRQKEIKTADDLYNQLFKILEKYAGAETEKDKQLICCNFVSDITSLVDSAMENPEYSFGTNSINKISFHKPVSKLSLFATQLKAEAKALGVDYNLNPNQHEDSGYEEKKISNNQCCIM